MCLLDGIKNLKLHFLYIPFATPHSQMQPARTTCERVNSTSLTWREVSVSPKRAPLVSGSARPPRSTSPSRPWGTSSLPWWTDAPSTSPTGTPSWPDCCRTLWEETRAPWWSPVFPPQTTTTRKAWARCVMPTGPRASRTGLVLMRTPRKLCSESIRRRSESCGPSSQASWALLTLRVSDIFSDQPFNITFKKKQLFICFLVDWFLLNRNNSCFLFFSLLCSFASWSVVWSIPCCSFKATVQHHRSRGGED